MEQEKTIDEKSFRLNLKIAVPFLVSMLFITNLGTRYITIQEQNSKDIISNDETAKRRIKNSEEKIALEQEIVRLEDKLEYCKNHK
ncbi:MAG: hypothetical protein QM499_00995 [Flavobacteriaceae bacterium]